MTELDTMPPQTKERIEQAGPADLVVGLLVTPDNGIDAVASVVREAQKTLSGNPRTVVIRTDGGPEAPEQDRTLVVSAPVAAADPSVSPVQSMPEAYRSVLAAGGKLEARACCMIASDLKTVTSSWILRLVQPVLEMDLDLVTACYAHHKFEGLLNSSIMSPLNRALYGKRIQNPMGPDWACSGKLLQRLRTVSGNNAASNGTNPLARLAPEAICGGFQVGEAHVGVRLYPPTDWTNLSTILAQILGPVFLDMERNAACWQRTRGSQPVRGFGEPSTVTEETGDVDVHRMVESFQLGTRNLQEIWGLVLPPSSLVELQKLARLPVEQFRMPDSLWARIVYDFALGHRVRTISRDHLLKAMTPLYLGWVASHALELKTAGTEETEQRLEQLARAYETAKPYLVSRWRWPDRFNP